MRLDCTCNDPPCMLSWVAMFSICSSYGLSMTWKLFHCSDYKLSTPGKLAPKKKYNFLWKAIMYFDDLFDIKGIIELSFQYSAYWFGNRLIERDHSCQQNLILPAFLYLFWYS